MNAGPTKIVVEKLTCEGCQYLGRFTIARCVHPALAQMKTIFNPKDTPDWCPYLKGKQ